MPTNNLAKNNPLNSALTSDDTLLRRLARLSPGPLVLLFLSIVVLQIHGIAFWIKHTGNTGVLWSLLLEGAALWFWSRRTVALMLLGVGASLLTLVGPLYEVGYKPLNEAWEVHAVLSTAPDKEAKLKAAHEAKRKALEDEKEVLIESLKTYQSNSQSRAGWLGSIERTTERLELVNTQLLKLADVPNNEELPSELSLFSGLFVVALQLVSLVMFQVLSIICVLTLAGEYRSRTGARVVDAAITGQTAKEAKYANQASQFPTTQALEAKDAIKEEGRTIQPKHTSPNVKKAEPGDAESKEDATSNESDPVLMLLARFDAAFAQSGMTQTQFAKKYGLSPKQLSFFRNHERRSAQNEETASAPFLAKIEALLEDF